MRLSDFLHRLRPADTPSTPGDQTQPRPAAPSKRETTELLAAIDQVEAEAQQVAEAARSEAALHHEQLQSEARAASTAAKKGTAKPTS